MARGVSMKGPGLSTRVAGPGRPPNANFDRSVVLRPPRLKLLKTREYGKPQPYPDASQNGSSGFGNTGLTGES